MMFLGSDYDVYYEAKRPTLGAKLMYAGFTLLFATMQFLLFEPILRVFILPYWLELTGGALGRWLLLVGIRALMMRVDDRAVPPRLGRQPARHVAGASLIVGIQAAAAAGGSSGGSGGGSSESSVRVADFWTLSADPFCAGRLLHDSPRGVLDALSPPTRRARSPSACNTHAACGRPAVVLADFGRKVSHLFTTRA